jgi:hypothetical protein
MKKNRVPMKDRATHTYSWAASSIGWMVCAINRRLLIREFLLQLKHHP